MAKQDNTDLKKVLFEEVLEEIEEEFQDSLADLIVEEHLNKIITDVQEAVKAKIKKLIENSDVEKMDDTQKLILGEKITRVVSKEAKIKLTDLTSQIVKRTLNLLDELRIEIIEEVFEETNTKEESED